MVDLENNKELIDAIPEVTTEPVQEAEIQQEAGGEHEQQAVKQENPAENEYFKHVQNWRALREAREQEATARAREQEARLKAEKERDEALAFAEKFKTQEEALADDDLAEGRHLKQYTSKLENRLEQMEARLAAEQSARLEAKVKADYPDFDSVVNAETVAMLRDADPDIARSIIANPDPYSQAATAYKAIKLYNLAKPSYDKEKDMIRKNVGKPGTATAFNARHQESPLSRANEFGERLTEERKKQIYEESLKIIRENS